MTKYFLKKTAGTVPLLIGITLITFLVIHLAPGSAVDAKASFNPKMTAQAKAKLESLYGLDRPILVQYADWMGRLVRCDFGTSFVDGKPVTEKILQAAPVTLAINLGTLLLILVLGIPLGVYGAVRAGTLGDKVLTVVVFAGFSVPTFWLSLILMSFFGVRLGWLPISGLHSLFYDEMGTWQQCLDLGRHLILPIGVAAFTSVAGISRYVRSGMIQVLEKPYIRTARAKGLSRNRVIYGHALPNVFLPLITILGLSIPGLLGGSVIFETIFSVPGMGRLFFDSVFTRDYPVIMGILTLGACLTLLGNFLADIGYALADPRIRVGEHS